MARSNHSRLSAGLPPSRKVAVVAITAAECDLVRRARRGTARPASSGCRGPAGTPPRASLDASPRSASRIPRLLWVRASSLLVLGHGGELLDQLLWMLASRLVLRPRSSRFPRSLSRCPRLLWVPARSCWYTGTAGNCSTSFFWRSRAASVLRLRFVALPEIGKQIPPGCCGYWPEPAGTRARRGTRLDQLFLDGSLPGGTPLALRSPFPRSASRIPRLLWAAGQIAWYSGTAGNCRPASAELDWQPRELRPRFLELPAVWRAESPGRCGSWPDSLGTWARRGTARPASFGCSRAV